MLRPLLLLLLPALSPAAAAPAPEGVWTFEKIARFDRAAEPVTAGMPFPRGLLRRADDFRLFDGGQPLPVQAAVTSRWPDGSVRWLLVRTLVGLPGNRGKQIRWRIAPGAPPPAAGVRTRRLEDGSIEVDTGALAARIPSRGFHPLADVRLAGQPVFPLNARFTLTAAGRAFSTADAGPVDLAVLESGPVAAQVRVKGRHGPPGSPFDFSALLTFWKDKPWVEVEYRVLLARGGNAEVESWEWTAEPQAPRPRLLLGYGHYTTRVLESGERVEYRFGPEQFRYDSVEHAMQSFWGSFWCDWTAAGSGLTVSLRHAQQNFPKALEATPSGIRLSLYPSGQPLAFPHGAAKTHHLLLYFHPAAQPRQELSLRALQHQIPDVARIDAAWYGRSGVWDERIFEGPRSRRIEALLYDVLDNRPVGLGIWNFGDEVDWGYTGQGRGRDRVVWLNNEYDFAHLAFLEYARTGERRFLDYAATAALHWRDVDIAHVSADPNRRGGHIAHSAGHVTGGVSPSHQWVEGLIDAWRLLGDREAYDAALGIGENILRQMALPQYRDPGASQTRDMGWALRALLALYRETGEGRYLDACRRIAGFFRQWHARIPGLLAPYTDHSMVRVVFMNSLTLTSLARYLRYVPDPELREAVLAEARDLVREGRNANGLFYYKELPSLRHQGATLLHLETLAHAYRLSGDRGFLAAGLPDLERALAERFFIHTGAAEKFLDDGGGYTRALSYPQGGKAMGTDFLPVLEFLYAARDPGLIRQTDFQFRLTGPNAPVSREGSR
ncbi:MAG: hypothetical protein IT158_09400 [Bryobacterales bacterium]|nr:hypothetical protein [Bryobacterales bacterium]